MTTSLIGWSKSPTPRILSQLPVRPRQSLGPREKRKKLKQVTKISYQIKPQCRTMLRVLPPLGIITPHSNNSTKLKKTSEEMTSKLI